MQEMAGRLAVHYRKEHRMQRRIQGALLYPKFLGLLSVFLVLAVFLVIMPTLEPLLGEMELPRFTRFLMAASIFLKEWWYPVSYTRLDVYKRQYLAMGKWWLALFPGLLLTAVVLMFHYAGQTICRMAAPGSVHE